LVLFGLVKDVKLVLSDIVCDINAVEAYLKTIHCLMFLFSFWSKMWKWCCLISVVTSMG